MRPFKGRWMHGSELYGAHATSRSKIKAACKFGLCRSPLSSGVLIVLQKQATAEVAMTISPATTSRMPVIHVLCMEHQPSLP